ncbi:hypothetical protein TWF102_004899 [Orbilia oligospora]|uniref:Uncharacterized protein n=1 Tax=Orbilia oligospora TaxID=2813651 RepID=A0A7C8JB64_ORBOL|nr:hypothetical protein TWF102_004899 [Orbilia oligospora]KAF3118380.1 hypothetical protein TWF103_000384 [Orbilia oligospora]KAF3149227.1 hypothetical protein TWF594_011278 [Orbilia oligospora]
MHFIRFLKVPTTTSKPSSNIITVSTLITISTDLSEAFYNGNATLRATLRADTQSRQLLASKTVTWTPGLRNIPIQFTFAASKDTASDGIVCISATENRADDMRILFAGPSESRILSAWSTPFNILQNGSKAEAFVERKLQLSAGKMVRIWEETREDIARHIWPGGLAMTSYLSTLPTPPTGQLPSLTPLLSNPSLNVLELGAGCGLAGIVLHTLLPSTKVTVTDLPITTEITSKNLTSNSNENTNNISYRPLDWASPLPEWCASSTYGLILVADCTYNTASIPYLVGVLDELCRLSPGVVILLAHKVRHDSEEMFFEMAGEKGIEKKESVVFEMAGDRVDLYVMGR